MAAGARAATTRGIALGFLIGGVVYAIGYLALPAPHVADTSLARLELALWLCAAPALFVYAAFFACLRLRDTDGALDPLRGGESERWKIDQRVLTNSVEQLAIFAPLFLALATRIDAAHVVLLPLHVGSWVVARIVFWWGYRRNPVQRAPGMAWTHGTSLATLAWLVRFSVG